MTYHLLFIKLANIKKYANISMKMWGNSHSLTLMKGVNIKCAATSETCILCDPITVLSIYLRKTLT